MTPQKLSDLPADRLAELLAWAKRTFGECATTRAYRAALRTAINKQKPQKGVANVR